MRRASTDDLIIRVGNDLLIRVESLAKTAYRELGGICSKQEVDSTYVSYVFWCMRNEDPPYLGTRKLAFTGMLWIMDRVLGIGTRFQIPDEVDVDDAVPTIAKHFAKWAAAEWQSMLWRAYQGVLKEHSKQVTEVDRKNGLMFLHMALPRVVEMRSAWFRDGELLRQVVKALSV